MTMERVSFPCGELMLEGILEAPAATGDGRLAAAVICHPHPLYGGAMTNNVTAALARGLLERDTICLRFNFRGTGRSQGAYGQGDDETDDVRAALDYLSGVDRTDPERVILAGYSFGCWVGLKAAALDSRPGRLIGVSPPVDEYDFGFLEKELRPILLMAGDRDFVCSEKKFADLTDSVPEPKMSVTFPGADHFHFGRENQLIREIHAFLDRFPWD
jgi:alpha/beta superfamily hydrolase